MKDLRAEIHFYGKGLSTLGIIYVASPGITINNVDILFFCMYTAAVFANRKVSLANVRRIMENLKIGCVWEDIFERRECRPFDTPVTIEEYLGMTKSVIRSQMLINKKVHFQFGCSGFGFFGNRKLFEPCMEGSVYGLMERIYRRNIESPEKTALLWKAAEAMGNIELGVELRASNVVHLAQRIHREVCGEEGGVY